MFLCLLPMLCMLGEGLEGGGSVSKHVTVKCHYICACKRSAIPSPGAWFIKKGSDYYEISIRWDRKKINIHIMYWINMKRPFWIGIHKIFFPSFKSSLRYSLHWKQKQELKMLVFTICHIVTLELAINQFCIVLHTVTVVLFYPYLKHSSLYPVYTKEFYASIKRKTASNVVCLLKM